MKEIGIIFLDEDNYVCIGWKKEVGKLVSENGLEERANEICDIICNDILNKFD